MPDVFADTSGLAHLLDPTQAPNKLASDIYRRTRQQGHRLVTTNYIVTELVALLTSPFRLPRTSIIRLVGNLKASPYIEIFHIDTQIDEQAWQLLTKRPDKDWSLVDCSSFIVMQQQGIQEALTTDHHFEQAGFTRLLKP
jgi:predicted nucleic acid-binding protein